MHETSPRSRSYCVFLGSSPGASPAYIETARALGRAMARRGVGLVYGGASVGCMAAVAEAALSEGGEVVGVMPQALVDKEVAHTELSEMRVVDSMHERKALMAELSDGFIALPGGLGTLEELFEVLTWAQLGFHRKPCALLDGNGYFNHLEAFLDHAVEQGFIKPVHRGILITASEPEALLNALAAYTPAFTPKWIANPDEL